MAESDDNLSLTRHKDDEPPHQLIREDSFDGIIDACKDLCRNIEDANKKLRNVRRRSEKLKKGTYKLSRKMDLVERATLGDQNARDGLLLGQLLDDACRAIYVAACVAFEIDFPSPEAFKESMHLALLQQCLEAPQDVDMDQLLDDTSYLIEIELRGEENVVYDDHDERGSKEQKARQLRSRIADRLAAQKITLQEQDILIDVKTQLLKDINKGAGGDIQDLRDFHSSTNPAAERLHSGHCSAEQLEEGEVLEMDEPEDVVGSHDMSLESLREKRNHTKRNIALLQRGFDIMNVGDGFLDKFIIKYDNEIRFPQPEPNFEEELWRIVQEGPFGHFLGI